MTSVYQTLIISVMNKENQKPSGTTIDDLAVMIKNGFDNTASKKDVEEIHANLTELGGKVDKIDERLIVVEKKLDRALYTELTHLEARVTRLEQKTGIKSSS